MPVTYITYIYVLIYTQITLTYEGEDPLGGTLTHTHDQFTWTQ